MSDQPGRSLSRSPIFWDDEDGEITWVEGHPEDWALRLALSFHLANEWDMPREEAATRAITCKVERRWLRMKDNDPNCEEFVPCSRWRRGAHRWTRIAPFEDQPSPWDTP